MYCIDEDHVHFRARKGIIKACLNFQIRFISNSERFRENDATKRNFLRSESQAAELSCWRFRCSMPLNSGQSEGKISTSKLLTLLS